MGWWVGVWVMEERGLGRIFFPSKMIECIWDENAVSPSGALTVAPKTTRSTLMGCPTARFFLCRPVIVTKERGWTLSQSVISSQIDRTLGFPPRAHQAPSVCGRPGGERLVGVGIPVLTSPSKYSGARQRSDAECAGSLFTLTTENSSKFPQASFYT